MICLSASEADTRRIGEELSKSLCGGDVVLLSGELGAGKTTLIRGVLEGLGHRGGVRSPTFNLIQAFETSPPVMHADLYRVKSYAGTGIEDYLETHLCLIEWPDRLGDLVDPSSCWRVAIAFVPEGRSIRIARPGEES